MQDDAQRREVSASHAMGPVSPIDAVEAALGKALADAATAGRFDVVAQLARELEERRLVRAHNVVPLDSAHRKKGV